jgi:hypothetical protein
MDTVFLQPFTTEFSNQMNKKYLACIFVSILSLFILIIIVHPQKNTSVCRCNGFDEIIMDYGSSVHAYGTSIKFIIHIPFDTRKKDIIIGLIKRRFDDETAVYPVKNLFGYKIGYIDDLLQRNPPKIHTDNYTVFLTS